MGEMEIPDELIDQLLGEYQGRSSWFGCPSGALPSRISAVRGDAARARSVSARPARSRRPARRTQELRRRAAPHLLRRRRRRRPPGARRAQPSVGERQDPHGSPSAADSSARVTAGRRADRAAAACSAGPLAEASKRRRCKLGRPLRVRQTKPSPGARSPFQQTATA